VERWIAFSARHDPSFFTHPSHLSHRFDRLWYLDQGLIAIDHVEFFVAKAQTLQHVAQLEAYMPYLSSFEAQSLQKLMHLFEDFWRKIDAGDRPLRYVLSKTCRYAARPTTNVKYMIVWLAVGK
jgi:hypothetical protein